MHLNTESEQGQKMASNISLSALLGGLSDVRHTEISRVSGMTSSVRQS